MAATRLIPSSTFLRPLEQTVRISYFSTPVCIYAFRHPLRSSAVQFSFRIRASSTVAVEPEKEKLKAKRKKIDVFACPVCYDPLIRVGPPGFNLPAIYRSGFKCETCNKTYSSKENYLDLTITAGSREYTEYKATGTEIFRSPVVSFLYERGWRQTFRQSGFPGPDEEFKMAQEYFKPAEGGFLVDASCGSGLFTRKFAQSGTYSGVVGLDFSENMLRQSYDFIKKEDTLLNTNLSLVRADVSRLPFASGSVDAVHAGAAIHCWPSPSNAIAEITRILRSGGVFVGTTFIRHSASTPLPIRVLRQGGYYNFLTEKEIEEVCKLCGLINYAVKVNRSFIMFSGRKP